MKTKGQNNHLGVKALNSVLPVILAFVIGGVIIAAIGENPLTAYQVMIQRSLFSVRGLTRTLQLAAPPAAVRHGHRYLLQGQYFQHGH